VEAAISIASCTECPGKSSTTVSFVLEYISLKIKMRRHN
jgi:hypothetical protein